MSVLEVGPETTTEWVRLLLLLASTFALIYWVPLTRAGWSHWVWPYRVLNFAYGALLVYSLIGNGKAYNLHFAVDWVTGFGLGALTLSAVANVWVTHYLQHRNKGAARG